MIIDDQISDNKMNMFIFISSLITSFIFTNYIMFAFQDSFFAIKSGIIMLTLSYINSIIVRYISEYYEEDYMFRIILIILCPEIISIIAIILETYLR